MSKHPITLSESARIVAFPLRSWAFFIVSTAISRALVTTDSQSGPWIVEMGHITKPHWAYDSPFQKANRNVSLLWIRVGHYDRPTEGLININSTLSHRQLDVSST